MKGSAFFCEYYNDGTKFNKEFLTSDLLLEDVDLSL